MSPEPLENASKPAAHALWWAPNALTLARLALAPVVFALLLMAVLTAGDTHAGALRSIWTAGAAAVFAIAALLDGLDGYLARRWGVESAFGRFWDPLADKAIVTAGLLGGSLISPLLWPAAVITLIRDAAVTRLRWRASRRGEPDRLPPSAAAKAKTALMFAGVLAVLGWIIWGALLKIVFGVDGAAAGLVSLYLGHASVYAAAALSVHTGLRYWRVDQANAAR